MDAEKVLKLAELARIRISPEEAGDLSREFGAILNYVSEVKVASGGAGEKIPVQFPVRNIMREDNDGLEPGLYTEKLLTAAPKRDGDYLEVKKIL